MRFRLLWLLLLVLLAWKRLPERTDRPAAAPAAPISANPIGALWGITQAPYTAAPSHQMTGDNLKAGLKLLGIPNSAVRCQDESYAVPDINWWLKFQPDYWGLAKKLGFRYKSEVEDCDDFARLYAMIAQHTFRLQYQEHTLPVLVGEFCYQYDTARTGEMTSRHAINIVAAWQDNQICFMFVEPQGGLPVLLSRREIASCYYVRF